MNNNDDGGFPAEDLSSVSDPRAVSTVRLRQLGEAGPWLGVAASHLDACDPDATHLLLATEPLVNPGPGVEQGRHLVVQVQLSAREGVRRVVTTCPLELFLQLPTAGQALWGSSAILGDVTDAMVADITAMIEGDDDPAA